MDLAPDSEFFRRWFSRFLLVVASVVAFPALSFAAHKHRKFHFDLFAEGGGSFFTPSNAQVSFVEPTTLGGQTQGVGFTLATGTLHDAARLSVGTDFWFTGRDAIQFSYSYTSANESLTVYSPFLLPGIPAASFISQSQRANFFSADYLHEFTLGRHWRLFPAGGIGAVVWTDPLYSVKGFAANFGGGAEYRLTGHWAVRADYRDYVVCFPFGPGCTLMEDYSPTVGLVYSF